MPLPLLHDDDTERPVDLGRIDGWDAICYQVAVGGMLEDQALRLTQLSKVTTAFDRTVVAWLWARQYVDPSLSLQQVAASVPLIPDEPPVQAADSDASEVT